MTEPTARKPLPEDLRRSARGHRVAIDRPYRFSAAPPRVLSPPPALGQHTREILAGPAGLPPHETDALLAAGATGA